MQGRPTKEPTRYSNPSPPDTLEADDSQGVVKGMQGLSNNFNSKKEKDITNREKGSSSTHQTLHTRHQSFYMFITDQVDEEREPGHKTVEE